MGCFLACFGHTNKRKRPKCCTNFISSNQVHKKYVPLDSEDSKISISDKKEKTKDPSSLKVKKKVSFNLDVKTYEPLNYDDNEIDNLYFSEGEEETKWEFNEEETQRATMVHWHQQKDNVTSYRYQNIQDSYDEDDEIMEEDIDLDDDIFDDEEWSDLDNDKNEDSEKSVGIKNQYVNSVLDPVENLTQWKSIKARDRLELKRQKGTIISEKENQEPEETINFRLSTTGDNSKSNYPSPNQIISHSKPLQNEIAVNVSLANWLLTSDGEPIIKV